MSAQTGKPVIGSALLGLLIALLGFVILNAGRQVSVIWSEISNAYAACGVAWILTGAAMIVGGLWTLASLGRQRTAIWMGAAGAILAGVILVGGVLTYVVPCSGPD